MQPVFLDLYIFYNTLLPTLPEKMCMYVGYMIRDMVDKYPNKNPYTVSFFELDLPRFRLSFLKLLYSYEVSTKLLLRYYHTKIPVTNYMCTVQSEMCYECNVTNTNHYHFF